MNITTANSGTFELVRTLAGRYQPPRRSLLPYILAAAGALLIAWPGIAKAESPRTDLVAHFGISSTINFAAYGVYRKMLDMHRTEACWFSFVTTNLIGIMGEMGDRNPDEADVWANAAGSVASNLIILGFEF